MNKEVNEQHFLLLKANSVSQNDSGSITEKKEKVNPFSKVTSISNEDAIIMVYEENTHFLKILCVQ